MTQKTPEFLADAVKFGINPGLERINGLCELLGHPERDFRVIHIAGTNGKGSATAFASSMLAASGLKTGVFTSPFLERFSERIRIIDGREGLYRYAGDDSYGEIDDISLARLTDRVREASEKLTGTGMEHPTEFELVTAICLLYFSEQKVDCAVMETGLGGRLDSTNIFDDPIASVITSIGMDHTAVLGDTIDKIAREKAGIMKKDHILFCVDPSHMILTDEQAATVRKTLTGEAAERGCRLEFIKPEDGTVSYTDDHKMEFRVDNMTVRTSLLGDHQCGNCSVAYAAVKEASHIWPSITEESCREGISMTVWKCRAEVLCTDPFVILDGGHNPQGARSFAEVYARLDGGRLIRRPVRLVIGVMADKDIEGVISAYRDCGLQIGEVWPVKVANSRTADPAQLYNIFKEVYNKPINRGDTDDPEEAVGTAYGLSLKDKVPLVVTGSLYLLGQVRGKLKGIIGCTTI